MARLTLMPGDPSTDPPRPEPQPPAPQAPLSEHRIHNSKAEQECSWDDQVTLAHSPSYTTTIPPKESTLTETTTYIAHADDDLIAALQLISDTVAQQRQLAAGALLSHWLYWTIIALPLPYFYVEWYHDTSDWAIILVVWAGIFMATMAVSKFLTRGYLDAAERVGRWSWLYGDQWIRNRFGRTLKAAGGGSSGRPKRLSSARVDTDPDFKTDFVFVTKINERITAALVLRLTNTWELNPTRSLIFSGKGDKLQKKAFIRAWAVERQLRGNGIGIALLRFVVRWCLDNGIDGPEFSDAHAHSLRLLPVWITPKMERNDLRARERLYWEIQHYNTPWWKEQREGRKVSKGKSPSQNGLQVQQGGIASCEYDYSFEDGNGSETTFQGIFSPRRKVEMSRAITKKILSGG